MRGSADPGPLPDDDVFSVLVVALLHDRAQPGPHLALDDALGLDPERPAGDRETLARELAAGRGEGTDAPRLLDVAEVGLAHVERSEEHTSELQSRFGIS